MAPDIEIDGPRPALRFRIFISVADVEAATRFYATLLARSGLRVEPGHHEFDLGTELLSCREPDLGVASWPLNVGTTHLTTTDSIDDIRARLLDLGGGTRRHRATCWFENAVCFDDPWDNALCIIERGTRYVRHRPRQLHTLYKEEPAPRIVAAVG